LSRVLRGNNRSRDGLLIEEVVLEAVAVVVAVAAMISSTLDIPFVVTAALALILPATDYIADCRFFDIYTGH